MSVDAAEFEVDAHGVESTQPEEAEPTTTPEEAGQFAAIVMGWTPEEATALVCALWNLGILLYGPDWAADPRETLGWNASVAQLLDLYVPKGVGGAVQVGAGLLMIGNGLMMMGARRWDVIKRGPQPIWVAKPKTENPEAPTAAPATTPHNGSGNYAMPRDLVPPATPDLKL